MIIRPEGVVNHSGSHSKKPVDRGPSDPVDCLGSAVENPMLMPNRFDLKVTGQPGAPLRDPQAGAAFVDKFQKEVGLDKEAQAAKDKLMVTSAAKFQRVNPALFYEDVKGPYAGESQLLDRPCPTTTAEGKPIYIVGDAHLGNLGTVRAADGETMWGPNDYDMAGKGKVEWDLERLASNTILMGIEDGKLSPEDALSCVEHMAKAYCEKMSKFGKDLPENSGLKADAASGPVKQLIEKSAGRSQSHMLKKFAVAEQAIVAGPDGNAKLERPRGILEATAKEQKKVGHFFKGVDKDTCKFLELQHPAEVLDVTRHVDEDGVEHYYALLKGTNDSPTVIGMTLDPSTEKLAMTRPNYTRLKRNDQLLDLTKQEQTMLTSFLTEDYDKNQGPTPALKRPLEILDMAERVESGGSTYRLHRYYALLKGTDNLPVMLEIKQELPTAPEQSSGDLKKTNAGHLFTAMQALGGTPDPMMTCATIDGCAYFVREREREKGSLDLTTLDPSEWKSVAEQAGTALAKTQAHQPGAATAINKWISKDQDKLIDNLKIFAEEYAEQTRQDTAAYAKMKGLEVGAQ